MNEPEATDDVVARPHPQSEQQSTWARELVTSAPVGPVLGLYCGTGEIGLHAVVGTGRSLLLVDPDPAACALAEENSRAVGLEGRCEVRVGFDGALRPDEAFALILADPPAAHTRACIDLAAGRLLSGGSAIVQVGTWAQVATLRHELSTYGTLQVVDVRDLGVGMLLRIDRLPAL